MCLLPAAISCSAHAVPVDPLTPSQQCAAEQVSRRQHRSPQLWEHQESFLFHYWDKTCSGTSHLSHKHGPSAHGYSPLGVIPCTQPCVKPLGPAQWAAAGQEPHRSAFACSSAANPAQPLSSPGHHPAIFHSQLPATAAPPPWQPYFPTFQGPQAQFSGCSCHLLIWGHPERLTRLIATRELAFKPLRSPQNIQMPPENCNYHTVIEMLIFICIPIFISLHISQP